MALPEKYRLPIYLHYYEGYSTEEIAAILGKPKGTVCTNLSRGREQLKEQLLKEERIDEANYTWLTEFLTDLKGENNNNAEIIYGKLDNLLTELEVFALSLFSSFTIVRNSFNPS